MTYAPVEGELALVKEVAEQLRDVNKARDLSVEAESRSLATETAVAGFARRLEPRFKQSNEPLRSDNAILRGQRLPDPSRPPRHQGPRYAPPIHSNASGEDTGDAALDARHKMLNIVA
uniref:Uncharacterized protein n=1 Tax=Peronospora matthiolae TaxID=2874970 RepID=A0AAV1VIS4_9STRA